MATSGVRTLCLSVLYVATGHIDRRCGSRLMFHTTDGELCRSESPPGQFPSKCTALEQRTVTIASTCKTRSQKSDQFRCLNRFNVHLLMCEVNEDEIEQHNGMRNSHSGDPFDCLWA